MRSLNRPSATVITVAGKWNAGRTGYTDVRKNDVFNVRAGRFTDAPHASIRIVANTRGVLSHNARSLTSDNTQWEIVVGSSQKVQAAVQAAAPAKRANVAAPTLTVADTDTLPTGGAARLAADLARPTADPAAPKDGRYPALLQTLRAAKPAPAVAAPAPPRAMPVVFRTPIDPVPADRAFAAAPVPAAPLAPAPAEKRVSLDFVNGRYN